MEISLKVLNRLRRGFGHDIAARVTPSRPENSAWVYVAPITDRYNFNFRPFSRRLETQDDDDSSIRYFLVRHLEVTPDIAAWFLEYTFDPDGDLGNPAFDDLYFPTTEMELEALLKSWKFDASAFYEPHEVDYGFEGAAMLIGRITEARSLEYGPGLIDAIRQGGFNGPKVIESEDRPLHYAARIGDLAQVKALLDSGHSIDAIRRGETPLHLAAKSGMATVAAVLLEQGADPNSLNEYEDTPLFDAIDDGLRAKTPEADGIAVIRLLLEHGADPNIRGAYKYSALICAASHRSVPAMALLLDYGATLERSPDDIGGWFPDGDTALISAICASDPDSVGFLVERGANVDARVPIGWCPLRYAVNDGNHDIVEILLAAGANVNPTDDECKSLLAFAEEQEDPWLALRLKSAGAVSQKAGDY